MTAFFKNSPWYGDVLLSAIIFRLYSYQFRFNSSCFRYASGGLILALLYRMTKVSTINTSSILKYYRCLLNVWYSYFQEVENTLKKQCPEFGIFFQQMTERYFQDLGG